LGGVTAAGAELKKKPEDLAKTDGLWPQILGQG
jgi:hypothetical protein